MISIFLKELNQFINSLIAYVVIVVFLLAIGLLMWIFPETSVLEYGYSEMETLFSLGPYILMFLIPAITMRVFSEEYKNGTIELLFTKPFTDWQIIGGKYLSTFTVVVLAILPTIFYGYTLNLLGEPTGNLDESGTIGSYIGLLSLSAVFCSIGLWTSSLTENQIIAFIVGVFLCFICYTGLRSVASINPWHPAALFIDRLGIVYHYESISKGLIDSRTLVYFASASTSFLFLTWITLSRRKW